MPGSISAIRRHLNNIEAQIELVDELRMAAKTDGGRMTPFGSDLIRSARDNGLQQAFIARLLDISPGAVSHRYNA